MKVRCINKNRDKNGKIISYTLQFEDDRVIQATSKEIKNEIVAKKYEFVNLQLDKVSRLVDKAEKKQQVQKQQKPVAQAENFYTIDELIRGVSPKGRKVICYDENTGKYVVGEGVKLYSTNKEIGNTILVYIEELNSNMKTGLIPLKDYDRFWAKYKEEFPYINKNMQDLFYTGKCERPDEETFQRILEFCKQSVDEFDLKFGFGKVGDKVDAKPNPEGRFTVSAIGKTPDKDIYKIKDKEQKKEYWEMYRGINPNVHDNQYTNVGIHRNENVLSDSIPVIDGTELLKKYIACKKKLENEIISRLDDYINWYNAGRECEIRVADQKEFNAICDKVKKLWETLEVEQSFDDLLFRTFEEIADSNKINGRPLYYGYYGDDSGWLDADVIFSFSKKVVKDYTDILIEEMKENAIWNGIPEEEELDYVMSFIHTNVYDEKDDDEYDWD